MHLCSMFDFFPSSLLFFFFPHLMLYLLRESMGILSQYLPFLMGFTLPSVIIARELIINENCVLFYLNTLRNLKFFVPDSFLFNPSFPAAYLIPFLPFSLSSPFCVIHSSSSLRSFNSSLLLDIQAYEIQTIPQ